MACDVNAVIPAGLDLRKCSFAPKDEELAHRYGARRDHIVVLSTRSPFSSMSRSVRW